MRVLVGILTRPHGIRGDIAVTVRTDDPGARFRPGTVLMTEPAERGPIELVAVRRHHGRLLVRVRGVADRTAAQRLVGTRLLAEVADRSAEPAATSPAAGAGAEGDAADDRFWNHELVGLEVRDVHGRVRGRVTGVSHGAMQDLLRVAAPDADEEILVPFVAALVPEVNVRGGFVVVDPPEGLMPG